MHYWLVKSEPHTWSWSDHQQAPEQTAEWDGVRNHQAKNNMKKMKEGDLVFFYHSGKERAIVGICEVVREAYPDPTDATERFVQVDLCAVETLTTPITLKTIKAQSTLEMMYLVRQPRLSVQPVTAEEWECIVSL